MPSRARWARVAAMAFALAGLLGASHAQTLRIGPADDPDILDPTLGRTFVGRMVFAALCDKLFDIDERLGVVPQLATGYEWSSDNKALTLRIREGVTFHDGRAELYRRVAAIVLKDRPILYLYHANVLWAYGGNLQGLRPVPDGLVRVQGLRLN